jgi:hypothetical protein
MDAGLSRVARAERFLDLSDYGRYAFGGSYRVIRQPRSPGPRIEQTSSIPERGDTIGRRHAATVGSRPGLSPRPPAGC